VQIRQLASFAIYANHSSTMTYRAFIDRVYGDNRLEHFLTKKAGCDGGPSLFLLFLLERFRGNCRPGIFREKQFQTLRIEADHHLIIHNDGWSGPAVQVHQLPQGHRIGLNILVFEGHIARLQKLLSGRAGRASGLAIEQNTLHTYSLTSLQP